jgi:hypothetical protein
MGGIAEFSFPISGEFESGTNVEEFIRRRVIVSNVATSSSGTAVSTTVAWTTRLSRLTA